MKHYATLSIIILSLLLPASVLAQHVFRGRVIDQASGQEIPEAQVRVMGRNISTLTNIDGRFILRVDTIPQLLEVSAVGYRNAHVNSFQLHTALNAEPGSRESQLSIRLQPTATVLKDVFVYSPENILKAAIAKLPQNYRKAPETYEAFYRETIRKRRTYVDVSEAVVNIYKTKYTQGPEFDQVHILKGRKLASQRLKDTLSVHVQGGPTESLYLDLVKNTDLFLCDEMLQCYTFDIQQPKTINDRPQYVISFAPKVVVDDPLYYGLIYIDHQTLSFTRIEYNMDMSDRDKATAIMLAHKPSGLRFRPRSLQTVINYYHDGQTCDLAYMRTTYRFDCDWKKRGLAVHYEAVSEMLITNHHPESQRPKRRDSFHRYDVLNKTVANFDDPDFWRDYNILQPSESLENAVTKLKKLASSSTSSSSSITP